MGGATTPRPKKGFSLPKEIKEDIRRIWGWGTPHFSHAAKQAVCWAIDNVYTHNLDSQVDIAISAGRLAEQLRGQGSDAFIQAFEEEILNSSEGESVSGI